MGKYIISDPNIMGGDIVIKGTRIPIDVILYRLKDGYSIEEIHRMYPSTALNTLKGAVGEAIDLLATNLHGKEVL